MVLCLSVKQWCNCVLLCFENVSMRVCQGRRKIILDTLEVEVFCLPGSHALSGGA